ncbi:hypothetical protein ABIC45_002895 [Mucilaginibacter rubeus]|uniref:hypothetical protein n=1 Tax=Mucilaginibacter rubeus TaxID=2027860 RepID=UPI0033931FA5
MKSLSKISALTVLAIAFTSLAQAQTTPTASDRPIVLSVGAEGGFSAGSFKHANKWNIGGSLQADFPVADKLYLTANAGYLNFFGKNNYYPNSNDAPDINLLPVKAGLKYFPVQRFYVKADAGSAFVLNKREAGYGKTAAFIYSPQIGVQLPLGGKNFIDAAAYYEASTKFTTGVDNSKVNFFGARLAYAFEVK